MRFLGLLVTILLLGPSCSKNSSSPDLCEKAVQHVLDQVNAGPSEEDTAKISDGERQVQRVVLNLAVEKCHREGLSQAQADCIFSLRGAEGFGKLAECPALQQQKPSWLTLSPARSADSL